MKFLIFEPSISGHHREYINHMICYAQNNREYNEYLFVLNEQYKVDIDQYNDNSGIKVAYINAYYENMLYKSNILIRSYKLTRCLNRFIKKYSPDRVILPYLPPFLPFLPFLIFKKKLISGIVFKSPQIFNNNIKFNLIERILYKYFYTKRCFNRIWLINNKFSATSLNEKLKTSQFASLADPINIIKTLNKKIVEKYSRNTKNILFHGGAMDKSKGTLDFIEALKLVPISMQKNYIIIFGGKISKPEERQILIDFIREYPAYEVLYDDVFISYEDLCSYISISDYIVIPYKRTEQSSGILGYAALYGVPVIGPKAGLLGKLIENNNLGITLEDTSPKSIVKIILNINKTGLKNRSIAKEYILNNSIEKFVSAIFSKE